MKNYNYVMIIVILSLIFLHYSLNIISASPSSTTTTIVTTIVNECKDPDGKYNFDTSSYCIDKNKERYDDYCSDSYVYDYSCNKYGDCSEYSKYCHYGCSSNGTCAKKKTDKTEVKTTTTSSTTTITTTTLSKCYDSDGNATLREQIYVEGYLTDSKGIKHFDNCSIGLKNSVVEYYCKSDFTYDVSVYSCPEGCLDGKCLGEFKTTATIITTTTTTISALQPKATTTSTITTVLKPITTPTTTTTFIPALSSKIKSDGKSFDLFPVAGAFSFVVIFVLLVAILQSRYSQRITRIEEQENRKLVKKEVGKEGDLIRDWLKIKILDGENPEILKKGLDEEGYDSSVVDDIINLKKRLHS